MTKRKTADRTKAGGGKAAKTQCTKDSPALQPALRRVLDALEQHGCKPKRSGNGWTAYCPVHERDGRKHSRSLSVAVGDDGRALLHCHGNSGCTVESIVKALGLGLADLMVLTPPGGNSRPKAPAGRRTQRAGDWTPKTYPTANAALAELRKRQGRESAKWTYRDANGQPVGVVVRWDKPSGKDVRPISRQGDGWRIGAMPDPRPLYNLPAILKANRNRMVFVVEGEKCVDALAGMGLLATTSAGGSKAAAKTDWTPLAGRTVWIVPDFDDAGEAYAQDVARLCHQAGAREVKVLDWSNILPGRELPSGYDLADAVAECDADPKALAELCARIDRAAEQTKPWRPDPTKKPGPVVVCMADVQPEPIRWLWPGRVPLGRITLLAGRQGIGKSLVSVDMAGRVSTGSPWPDGEDCRRGSVLVLAAEDDPADTIRPRLDAARADPSRVYLLQAVRRIEEGKPFELAVTLADVGDIEEAVQQLPDCRLLIVDPIGSYLGSRTDGNAENQVRGVLQPLADLARRHGFACLIVVHRRKAPGVVADDTVLGSRAFTALARAVWHVCHDPANKDRRLFLPGKMNLAGDVEGLSFTIGDEPPRVFWDREPVAMTADDALAAEAEGLKRGPEARALAEAKRLLREALAEGPRPAKDVEAELMDAGITKKTIRNARESLGVASYKDGYQGQWFWRLPETDYPKDAPQRLPGSETRASLKNPEKNALFAPKGAKDAPVFEPRGNKGIFGLKLQAGLDS